MIRAKQSASLQDAELKYYNGINETQLYHALEPRPGYFLAESAKCVTRALEAGYEPNSLLLEDIIYNKYLAYKNTPYDQNNNSVACNDIFTPDDHDSNSVAGNDIFTPYDQNNNSAAGDEIRMLDIIESYDYEIPVYILKKDDMLKITGYNLTGGILCLMNRRNEKSLVELLNEYPLNKKIKIVVLDDVENPTNVGALFRCSAALGADLVIVTNNSADPLYRRSARVSMGTVFQVPFAIVDKKDDYISILKDLGIKTAAMALSSDSVNIDDPSLNSENRLALILGNEGYGLPAETIAKSDYTVCIPMAHGVDSLNVAAAGAIAIWQLIR